MTSTIQRPLLINFRCLPSLIRSFDDACSVAKKTRTEVLIDLMRQYVANASAAINETKVQTRPKIDSEAISRPIRVPAVFSALDTTNLREKRRMTFLEWLGVRRDQEGSE